MKDGKMGHRKGSLFATFTIITRIFDFPRSLSTVYQLVETSFRKELVECKNRATKWRILQHRGNLGD